MLTIPDFWHMPIDEVNGGRSVSDAKRLKELEAENNRLKKLRGGRREEVIQTLYPDKLALCLDGKLVAHPGR